MLYLSFYGPSILEVSSFGNTNVLQIRIIKDRDSGESKGYAFISFKTKEAAQKAIEELHGKEVKVIVGTP